MTVRRVRIGVALAGAALACTGFAALAAPATAAPAAPSAAPASSATTAASTANAPGCHRYPWQSKIYGEPKHLGAGSESGVYLWREAGSFHLRVTHAVNHDRRIYSGVVRSSTPMHIERYRLERGDTVKLSASRHSFVFVLANHGRLDGVNFQPDCASHITVSKLHVGSHELHRSHVFLGYHRDHPYHIPFDIHRINA